MLSTSALKARAKGVMPNADKPKTKPKSRLVVIRIDRRNGKGHPKGEKYTVEEVIAAIEASGGLQYRAATALDCSVSTILNYIHRYPDVQAAYIKSQNGITNVARSNVAEAIADDGNLSMSTWWLSRRAPEFSSKMDVEIVAEVVFRVVYETAERSVLTPSVPGPVGKIVEGEVVR